MPWFALPNGGTHPAALGELFNVCAVPCLVLLRADGSLISDDGLRLLRSHGCAFPWSFDPPPATPHHQPLCERLLRRRPVRIGNSVGLSDYLPLDFLQMPEAVTSWDEAVAALHHCDKRCVTALRGSN
eukprot:1141667-Prymnesium_polylepis.1